MKMNHKKYIQIHEMIDTFLGKILQVTPMRIEIFGIERSKCLAIMEHVGEILEDFDIEAQVDGISEPIDIHKRGIFLTPAVAVNGQIKISGRVPSKNEIIDLIL
jgi:hypothetical protein